MDLKDKNLDDWFLEEVNDFTKFPHGEDYPTKYKSISEQLYKWVHPDVGIGATTTDSTFLTNHGVNHIKTLIARATQFVGRNKYCTLSAFEIYLLLMSIHVHDVGNILGRPDHEFNAKVIIDKLKSVGIVGQDDWIWDYIYDIAKAHKGFQLETLPKEDFLHEISFRPQLLAAILKFADELAEDFSRASEINIVLENVPDESKLYHVFARCVNSIIPNPESGVVNMIFNLKAEQLGEKFKKDGKDVFLVDEIYLRTLRTYSENVYCKKFLRPYINFNTIKVTINVRYGDGTTRQHGYELCENIVSEINIEQVFKRCPELKEKTGQKMFDEYEKSKIYKSEKKKTTGKKRVAKRGGRRKE